MILRVFSSKVLHLTVGVINSASVHSVVFFKHVSSSCFFFGGGGKAVISAGILCMTTAYIKGEFTLFICLNLLCMYESLKEYAI